MDTDIKKKLKLQSSLLNKIQEEQKIKFESLSHAEFLKFEEKNIIAILDLLREDEDNRLLMTREVMANPYISLYDVPLVYQTETMEEEEIYKTEKVVFYPSLLATGDFRIQHCMLKMYGNFLNSFIRLQSSIALSDIVTSSLRTSTSQSQGKSLIENKIVSAIRNLLSDQFLILK